MEDFLANRLADLTGRIHGPMNVRLFIQPLIAAIFAVRAGLRDAREGSPPYNWALVFDAGRRRALLLQGWHDLAKVFLAAIALDVVYQVMALHFFYPIEAVIVAIVLAVIPYLVLRPLVTRLFGHGKGNP